jgi:hypothetical protein
MQYLALIYADESGWEGLPDDVRKAWYARYRAFADTARANEQLVDANELAPTSTATTVRVRDGETIVTDGPFVETKEALGGYFLLECDSFDQAVDLAAQIPGAEHGAVEVRPVAVDEAAEQAHEPEEVVA